MTRGLAGGRAQPRKTPPGRGLGRGTIQQSLALRGGRGPGAPPFFARRGKSCLQTGREVVNYLVIIGQRAGQKGGGAMKGYNDRRRRLFVRVTAIVLAVLMVATVFSVLLLR